MFRSLEGLDKDRLIKTLSTSPDSRMWVWAFRIQFFFIIIVDKRGQEPASLISSLIITNICNQIKDFYLTIGFVLTTLT